MPNVALREEDCIAQVSFVFIPYVFSMLERAETWEKMRVDSLLSPASRESRPVVEFSALSLASLSLRSLEITCH